MIQKWLLTAMAYRLHVILLAFTILLVWFGYVTPDTLMISAAFALGMGGVYLCNKYTDFREDAVNVKSLPVAHSKALLWISLACLLLPLIILHSSPSLTVLYIAGPVLVSFLYNFPFKNFRLKKILLVKNISSAVVWASLPAMVPTLYAGQSITHDTFNIFVMYFAIVLSIEIFWDIRDVQGDLEQGIKTLPNQYGLRIAQIVCLVLVGAVFVRDFFYFDLPMVFSLAYCGHLLLIAFVKPTSGPLYFQSVLLIWLAANIACLAGWR